MVGGARRSTSPPRPPTRNARRRALRRLTIDGYALTEQWIEPEMWSWIY